MQGHQYDQALERNDVLARAQYHLNQGEIAVALQLLQQALQQYPNDVAIQVGYAVALRFAGQIEQATQVLINVLQIQPHHADAQVYLAMLLLLQGQQEQGWALYRARWQASNWTEKMRYPVASLWQGKVYRGFRLLLWGEQGFGDVIQFVRYVPWLAQKLHEQGASLVLEVAAPLYALFRETWPDLDIQVQGAVTGRFDAHFPLMDLPQRWGKVGGELPYLPQGIPYLKANASAKLLGVIPYPPARLRVGILWQGRPTHPDDKFRSIAFSKLLPLFELPYIQWVCLQKEGTIPAPLQADLADCQNFADTAAVIANLDLVISIDSAIAHLAAALGKPVWLLLPRVPDWRWHWQGDTTAWYPNMRLFRQGAGESWDDVLVKVKGEILAMCRYF